jgi:hypothetical protein
VSESMMACDSWIDGDGMTVCFCSSFCDVFLMTFWGCGIDPDYRPCGLSRDREIHGDDESRIRER